jgi:tRNA(Arg) A34 adenosine deaminase TadA
MINDDFFIKNAVMLAQKSVDSGDGGPFGAIVVCDGKIIGEGWNQVVASNDPTAHAEVMAIRAACLTVNSFHLPNSTLYASSEPCPMCLSAAYWASIERIVFANRRCEAAAIGFCDDALYRELSLPAAERRIISEHYPLPEALVPLQNWFANPRSRRY